LLKSLFPVLPRTTSSSLRASIRRTILSDIRTANIPSSNHKLNRAVQAMLFNMVEHGLDGEVVGDKGKPRSDLNPRNADDAMWAIILTKELWRKGIWCALTYLLCVHTDIPPGRMSNLCPSWLWDVFIP
jgi:protein SDA1